MAGTDVDAVAAGGGERAGHHHATIAPTALIGPAAAAPEVEVTAIAARDRTRAEAFARRHGIAQVHDSYADLLTAVDAVY